VGDHVLFGITFVILAFVRLCWPTKLDALQLSRGFDRQLARAYTLKRRSHHLQLRVKSPRWSPQSLRPCDHVQEGQKIMVAARGITPVLSFALDEAQLRKATLFVLYVKEVAVYYTAAGTRLGRSNWQDDPEANAIMCSMRKLGSERGINVVPLYAISQDASATIVDLAATMGMDFLVIGASQRPALVKLLRGSVATNVAQQLPESIQLLISANGFQRLFSDSEKRLRRVRAFQILITSYVIMVVKLTANQTQTASIGRPNHAPICSPIRTPVRYSHQP
jgi:nucleotide-binding universal stress UspA family protein